MQQAGYHRPRLILLLGAGASAHAGAPSTAKVTERVCALNEPDIQLIIDGLRKQRGPDRFNFETVMAALEDLQEYTDTLRSPDRWTRETINAFTQLSPVYAERLSGEEKLSVFRARLELLNGIFDFFIRETPQEHPDRLQTFVDRLRHDFDLTVLTLNYDDLIDRTGPWFDGFAASDEKSADYDVFNPGQFVVRALTEPNVLLHLHGSVRFGRMPRSGTDIVKYHSAGAARQAPIEGERSRQWAAPIVSGHQKERWLQRYVAPLGYYYNAFLNAAVSTPLWLIAGYGANDVHVNTWVMESMRIHGERARVVHIDTARLFHLVPDLLPGCNIPSQPQLKSYYGPGIGNFPPQNAVLEEIVTFLRDGASC